MSQDDATGTIEEAYQPYPESFELRERLAAKWPKLGRVRGQTHVRSPTKESPHLSLLCGGQFLQHELPGELTISLGE